MCFTHSFLKLLKNSIYFFAAADFLATVFLVAVFLVTAFLATAFLAGAVFLAAAFFAFALFLSALNTATIVLWFFRTIFETFVSNCSKRCLYYTQGLADCRAN